MVTIRMTSGSVHTVNLDYFELLNCIDSKRDHGRMLRVTNTLYINPDQIESVQKEEDNDGNAN